MQNPTLFEDNVWCKIVRTSCSLRLPPPLHFSPQKPWILNFITVIMQAILSPHMNSVSVIFGGWCPLLPEWRHARAGVLRTQLASVDSVCPQPPWHVDVTELWWVVTRCAGSILHYTHGDCYDHWMAITWWINRSFKCFMDAITLLRYAYLLIMVPHTNISIWLRKIFVDIY